LTVFPVEGNSSSYVGYPNFGNAIKITSSRIFIYSDFLRQKYAE